LAVTVGCAVDDLKQSVIDLVSDKNTETLLVRVAAWLEDEKVGEHHLAWVFGFCFEKGVDEVVELAPRFITQYPASVFPVRIFFADLLLRKNLFDEASHEARIYLRCVRDAGIIQNLKGKPLLADGIARAFLILTGVYTEAGSRTYSRGVLQYARTLGLPREWQDVYESEICRLDHEISADACLVSLDEAWKTFLENGAALNEVLTQCARMNFAMLSKRVELLHDRFRFDSCYTVDPSEMFMLVMQDDRGRLSLA
jgi:hypothetical protein